MSTKDRFKLWVMAHAETISLLLGLFNGFAVYYLSKLSFEDNIVKGCIVMICAILPETIMFFNKKSLPIMKEVLQDLLFIYVITYSLSYLVSAKLDYHGVVKFRVYFIFTVLFHVISDYLVTGTAVARKSEYYYMIHSKLTGLCIISYFAGYIAYLGYYSFDEWFNTGLLMLLVFVIANTSFTIALSMVIHNTWYRGDFNDKEGKEIDQRASATDRSDD